MNRIPLRSSLPGVLVALLISTCVFAQEGVKGVPLYQADGTLVLDTLAHRFVIPLPDWLSETERASGDALPLIETSFSTNERQAVLEIMPKGQSRSDWETLYAARITLEPERALIDYRRSTMAGYAQTCHPALTGFFQLGEDNGETLAPLGFVCGAFVDRSRNLTGRGEVMIMSFKRTRNGIAAIYQEWRGRAFDPTVPSAWPVSTDVVEIRARQFQEAAVLLIADD